MSKSRYSDTQLVDGKYYRSFKLPKVSAGLKNIDLLAGVKTTEYVFKVGDRLDHLAARFLGDDEYWWVIALVNGINDLRGRQPRRESQAEADNQERDERMNMIADDEHEQRDQRRRRTEAGPEVVHGGFV